MMKYLAIEQEIQRFNQQGNKNGVRVSGDTIDKMIDEIKTDKRIIQCDKDVFVPPPKSLRSSLKKSKILSKGGQRC